jgi:hypothetical protein
VQRHADAQQRVLGLAQRGHQRRKESTSWRKRRWRSDSGLPSKPPTMYSTGSSVRRMPVSRAASISACDIAVGIVVGPAVGLVVQVVELAHAGVAGFQHLDVELRGDVAQRLGSDAAGEAVHQFAPGPELSCAPTGVRRGRP